MTEDVVGFHTTYLNGYRMDFANGVTISVQWKPGNYCENYNVPLTGSLNSYGNLPSPDAEIAIWVRNGDSSSSRWITRAFYEAYIGESNDDVIGRLTPDQVAMAIIWAQSLTPYNIEWAKRLSSSASDRYLEDDYDYEARKDTVLTEAPTTGYPLLDQKIRMQFKKPDES